MGDRNMPKLCPFCDRKTENEKFCDNCGRPCQELSGSNTKKDKAWRESVKKG